MGKGFQKLQRSTTIGFPHEWFNYWNLDPLYYHYTTQIGLRLQLDLLRIIIQRKNDAQIQGELAPSCLHGMVMPLVLKQEFRPFAAIALIPSGFRLEEGQHGQYSQIRMP